MSAAETERRFPFVPLGAFFRTAGSSLCLLLKHFMQLFKPTINDIHVCAQLLSQSGSDVTQKAAI